MNINNELADFDAAGALAEELPWWGWLEDGRSCLTRAGELMSIARLTPSVLDGQTPEQLDRIVDRWQRMLSGVDSRTRLYFYLLAASHPIRGPRRGRRDRALPPLDGASGGRSLRNEYRALAPMSHGRMIRAYPP